MPLPSRLDPQEGPENEEPAEGVPAEEWSSAYSMTRQGSIEEEMEAEKSPEAQKGPNMGQW